MVCAAPVTRRPDRVPARLRHGPGGIVSKRLGSRYVSGRSKDWLKFKNPNAPAVQREAEEEWGKEK
jgi:ATP-dependent DNA ligase